MEELQALLFQEDVLVLPQGKTLDDCSLLGRANEHHAGDDEDDDDSCEEPARHQNQ